MRAKPTWLDNFQWQWPHEGELSKLLGTTCGLSLQVQDVNNFLIYKIRKKTMYWGSRHLSLAGRSPIVNHVLAFTLWYLVIVQTRSWKAIRNIKRLLRIIYGGLSLIDPVVAIKNLLVKWVLKAFEGEGEQSNLQILLWCRLRCLWPDRKNKWSEGMRWIFLPHHIPKEKIEHMENGVEEHVRARDIPITAETTARQILGTQHTHLMEPANLQDWPWVLQV